MGVKALEGNCSAGTLLSLPHNEVDLSTYSFDLQEGLRTPHRKYNTAPRYCEYVDGNVTESDPVRAKSERPVLWSRQVARESEW